MKKTRILSMLLTVAMIMSFVPAMASTVSAEYAAESVELSMTAPANANVGDTIEVTIYAENTAASDQAIEAVNFEIGYGTDNLTFNGITAADDIADELIVVDESTTGTKKAVFAYANDAGNDSKEGGAPLTVAADGKVAIATASFTVADDASGEVEFSLVKPNITLVGDASYDGYTPAATGAKTKIHNITITVNTLGLDIGEVPAELYAKYGEKELYTDAARTAEWTIPTAKAATGYRLDGDTWYLGTEEFDLGTAEFTESGELSYPVVETFTVTIEATIPEGVTITKNEITVDTGAKLLEKISGLVTENNFYEITGYKVDGVDVDENTTVTENITVVVQVSATAVTYQPVNYKDVVADSAVAPEEAVVSAVYGDTLKVTPKELANYVIDSVTYVKDGETDEIALTDADSDGTYESADKLEGNVTVNVYYRKVLTVTVEGVEGAVVTTTTLYAKENLAGLYSDDKCTDAVSELPAIDLAEGDGTYQYIASDKPWKIGGTEYTVDEILEEEITADITKIVPAVKKQYKITFVAGDDITFEGKTELWVTAGDPITAPTPSAPNGYYDIVWDKTVPTTATEAGTYTANAIPMQFDFVLTDENGVAEATSGVSAENKVTYNTDVVITVTADAAPTVVITVGGAAKTIDPDVSGNVYTYTIPGADVKGKVEVTVTTQIAVTFSPNANDEGADASFTAATYYVVPGGNLADKADEINALAKPAAGYKFNGWKNGDVDVDLANATFDETVTVYAEFVKEDYTIDLPDGLNTDAEKANIGVDVVITPDTNRAITAITYKIGENGEEKTLNADADGKFTIPGNEIVGNITVTIKTELDVEFIDADTYMALKDTTKIVVIKSDVNDTTYTLSQANGGAAMYYAANLGGYAYIVDENASKADIAKGLTVTANAADAIVYDGDLSGNKDVNSGDAALLSQMLHTPNADYTVVQRLSADIDGNKCVTTAEALWILKASVGLN